jgi:glycolate oxidase FAD binding subunit
VAIPTTVGPEALCIDSFGPLPVLRPASAAEVGDLVRRSAADGQAVYPLGGRTQLAFGLPPSKRGLALDLCGLSAVLDYPARDMTITVQAGITVAALQEILAREGQRLPVDVPRAAEATLGGAIATNTSGPRRYGFGTLRDYVIGVSVLNDRGEEVKAGGRVVKNVAGYDLCKLYVGSLGTLGIISQVTLKLRPLPEEQALVLLHGPSEKLADLLELLHRSRTRPVCLEALNAPAARLLNTEAGVELPESGWVVLAGFEGGREAVAWQVQQLVREVAACYPLEARVGSIAVPLWRALAELPGRQSGPLTFKANLLASATAGFCRRVSELPDGLLLQAHAGNGIIVGHAPNGLTMDRAAALLKTLREWAAVGKGQVVLPRCPTRWKETLSVWGPPPADAWLMRAVKQQLDPHGLFNPGRFVDGI